MWDCPECGCQGIVPTLEFCPQCFAPRPEEESVPAEGGQPVASDDKVPAASEPASPQAPNDIPDWGE
jgi:uncharacterized OB-fold protein